MDKNTMIDQLIFGQRLKYLMTNFHETTYSMSEKFKLSPPSISRYTRGEMVPKVTTIRAMADYFDVSPEWLMGNNNSMYSDIDLMSIKDSSFDPKVEISVFQEIKYNLPLFSNKKSVSTLSLSGIQLTKWGSVFALELHDVSMAPTLLEKDIVVIKINTFLQSGDLTAIHVNQSNLMIRKVLFKKHQIILQPHNPQFPVEIYDLHKDNVQIIGSVVYQKRLYEHYFDY
ncbi:MAG: XRE family transcriptional regulator [Eubacterium sp.]